MQIGRHLALDLEQCIHRQQPVVADVHMAADGEQAPGDGEVAIAQRTLDHRFDGQQRLELAPQRNAFQERARAVPAAVSPSDSVASRWKCESTNGGEHHLRRAASMVMAASAAMAGSTCCDAAVTRTARSIPVRPSGSVALRMIRSKDKADIPRKAHPEVSMVCRERASAVVEHLRARALTIPMQSGELACRPSPGLLPSCRPRGHIC